MEATVTGLWLLTSSWITARSIIGYMGSCGYDYQYLGVDHEEHYFFYPLEREHNIVLVDSPWLTYGKRHLTFEEAIPNWDEGRLKRPPGARIKGAQVSNPFTVAGFIESFKIREAMRLKQPLPETELARLMQPMRLTNVNRDDDRISLLMRRYQDDYRADDIAIRVRNLLVHRLFSCEEGIEAWGWPRTPEEIIERAWMAEGTRKNSNINFGWKSAASAMRDCTCLVQLASKEVAPLLSALKVHSRKVHKLLESGWPMFGDFLAFQATLDLYWLFPERLEDDWAEFRISHPEINRTASATTFPFLARGSGTTLRLVRGLPIACVKPGNISPSCIGTKEMLPLGRQFRDEVAQAIGPQPLHVIEHWLCEYGKISLAQLGLGATRPRNPAPKNPGPAIRCAGA